MFLADGSCWGGAGMVRAGRTSPTARRTSSRRWRPPSPSATRLAVRSEAGSSMPGGHPAIVVIGPGGELRALTPAGQEWRDRLDQIAPGRFMVMMQVMAVGASQRLIEQFPGQVAEMRRRPMGRYLRPAADRWRRRSNCGDDRAGKR